MEVNFKPILHFGDIMRGLWELSSAPWTQADSQVNHTSYLRLNGFCEETSKPTVDGYIVGYVIVDNPM